MATKKSNFFYGDLDGFLTAPDVYALDIALEEFFMETFQIDIKRIVYAGNDYAFKERLKSTKSESLDLPFLNYKKTGYGECNRNWIHMASNLGHYVIKKANIEAEQLLKYFPTKVEYEASIFFDQDRDKETAVKNLLFAGSAETMIFPIISTKKGHQLKIPAVVEWSFDVDPACEESDWLEKNKMHCISMNLEVSTIMVVSKSNEDVGIAESVVAKFLASKNIEALDKREGIQEYFGDKDSTKNNNTKNEPPLTDDSQTQA